ncbi:MAG: DUF4097 domain-containing protein [Pygmaiobacter massiliensis]|nr:DUF4097 domain-containing protein [Pygmaiobacter massiliensis]
MKSFYKVVAFLGVALICLGGVMGITGSFAGGAQYLKTHDNLLHISLPDWSMGRASSSQTVSVSVPQQPAGQQADSQPAQSQQADQSSAQPAQYDIYEIELELGAGNFYLQQGDGFDISCSSGNLSGISSKQEKGVWKIEVLHHANGWNHTSGDIVITVPADFVAQKLEVELGAGSLRADGITAREASLEVAAGQMNLTNCDFGNADFECGMGEMTYSGKLWGIGSAECGMGKLELGIEGQNWDDFGYKAECAVGNITVLDQVYTGLATELTVNPQASVFYELECGAGTLTVYQAD